MPKTNVSFHSPYSSHYDDEQDFDLRSFWSRDEVLEMDLKFKAAVFDSEEWKARLKSSAGG